MTNIAPQNPRKKYLSLLCTGTAGSILLQSVFGYSFTYAATGAWSADTSDLYQGSKNNKLVAYVSPAANAEIKSSSTVNSGSVLDALEIAPGAKPELGEQIVDSSVLSSAKLGNSAATLAMIHPGIQDDSLIGQSNHSSGLYPTGRLVAAGDPLGILSGSVSVDEVENLTKQIAARIFELERLNTYFRIESTKVGRWRKWRTFVGDEVAAQTVGAGVLVIIIYALRGLHRGYTQTVVKFHGLTIHGKFFQLPPNTALEAGIITTIPGIWVGVAQEMFELGANYFNDWKAKQRGFDPKTTRAKATQIQNDIDRMLAERANLVNSASATAQERELQDAEGKVLKDMRDLALHEYIDYYSRAKRVRSFENTFYLVDIAERTTGFTSLLMGLISLHLGPGGRNRLGALGVLQVVSAILAPAAPITGRLVSSAVHKAANRSIAKDINGFNVTTAEAFDADRKHLEDLILNSSGSGSPVLASISSRAPLYRMEKDNFSAIEALRAREMHDAKSAFWQSVGIRSIACGNKVAFGSVAMAGGWTHLNNPRHYDQLLLGATTPYYVTLQLAGADAIRRTVSGQVLERRDRAKGYLPKQVYKARLDQLEKMEALVNPDKK